MQGKFGSFKNLNRGRTDMLEELDDVIIAKVLIFIIYELFNMLPIIKILTIKKCNIFMSFNIILCKCLK